MFTREHKASPQASTVLRQAASNGNVEPHVATGAGAQGVKATGAGVGAIKLSRPIQTHSGEQVEIVLREPTVTDYIEIGDIDTVIAREMSEDGQPQAFEVVTNNDNLMKWAVRLTGLDRIVLTQLAPVDVGKVFREVRFAVRPFQQGNS